MFEIKLYTAVHATCVQHVEVENVLRANARTSCT